MAANQQLMMSHKVATGGGSFGIGVTAKGNSGTSSVTTNSVTSQSSGSTFVIDVIFDSTTTVTSISDSKSNTYTLQGSTQTNNPGDVKTARYICVNGTGGATHNATATFSAVGAVPSIFFTEIKGGLTSGIVDIHVQANGDSPPFTVASGTLAQANEYVLCLFSSYSSTPPTCSHSVTGDNFVKLEETTDYGTSWVGAIGGVKVSATTSVTPSWTETNTPAGASLIITSFKGP